MRLLFTTLLISMLLLTGCGNPTDNGQVYVGAEAGPVDVTVAVDNNGQVSVSGGVAPKFKVGLGPIELKIGIQKTLELTKEKPFTLFVIWEDESGEIQREEYEIGKTFNVKFTQNELIQEIQGDNNSVIVAVKRPKAGLSASDSKVVIVTSEPKVVVVTTTPQKATNFDSSGNCPNTSPSKLHTGDTAKITIFQVSGRSAPGFNSSSEHVLSEGRVVSLIDGPKCADNAWWWKVHYAGTVSTGKYLEFDAWMPEVEGNDYYLISAP